MSDSWDYSNTIADNAKAIAIARSKRYWASFNWFMWKTFNTVLNTTWEDPWKEQSIGGSHLYESGGITNESPDYNMTQNAYFIFAWLASHGYNKYSITAILTSWTNESTLTGGAWEGNYHPFESILTTSQAAGFDPTINPNESAWALYNLSQTYWNYNWRNGSNQLVFYQASATDTRIHQTFTVSTVPGSYDSIVNMGKPVETYTEVDPGTGIEYTRVRMPPRFDPNVYGSHGGGYGLAQWTPFSRLPALANNITPDGNKHWQLNPTLQLEIMEYQRTLSRSSQTGQYLGGWVDSNASYAKLIAGTNLVNYGASITWDQFASDSSVWINWVTDQAAYYGITSSAEIEWMKRQFAIEIWVRCYEQATYDYSALQFRMKSNYWFQCVERWFATGYDIADVPRSRDVKYCSLDKYHVTPETLPLYINKKRGKHHVSTILLRSN